MTSPVRYRLVSFHACRERKKSGTTSCCVPEVMARLRGAGSRSRAPSSKAAKPATGREKKPGKNTIAYEHMPGNRVSHGYPSGGISLGIQQSSWFDIEEGNLWLRDEYGRHPASSLTNQPERILVLDGFRVDKNGAFQKQLEDRHNTTTIMIPRGLTPAIQPCDRTINKEF